MASPLSNPKLVVAAAAGHGNDAQYDPEEARMHSDSETWFSEGPSSIDSNTSFGDKPDVSIEVPQKTSIVRSWWTRWNICRFSCGLVSLVVITLLLVFLWPRKPDWHVQKLIVPPATLNDVIQAFTKPSDNNITVDLDAVVDFSNPNFIGAQAGKGHFDITWEGHELARVTTEAGLAPARGHSQLPAFSMSVITPALGTLMMHALPGKNFQIQVNVKGELPATVGALFGLKVRVSVDCVVDVSLMMIMSAPEKLVTGHQCKYGVGF